MFHLLATPAVQVEVQVPGPPIWLQILASAATLGAALVALGAAVVAFLNFQAQKKAAEGQQQLTSVQLDLAKKSASQEHLRGWFETWNSDTYLRWRSLISAEVLPALPGPVRLSSDARSALDELVNMFDLVGYATKQELIGRRDAWEWFSANWEPYWLWVSELVRSSDPTVWANADWLFEEFKKISAAEGAPTGVSPEEMQEFARAERDRVRISGPGMRTPSSSGDWRKLLLELPMKIARRRASARPPDNP